MNPPPPSVHTFNPKSRPHFAIKSWIRASNKGNLESRVSYKEIPNPELQIRVIPNTELQIREIPNPELQVREIPDRELQIRDPEKHIVNPQYC